MDLTTPEAPVSSKEIPLKFSVVRKLREEQDLSYARIAEELGSNAQSVEACYKAKEDRVYRPRGPQRATRNARKQRAANGNRAKLAAATAVTPAAPAKNGNGNGHRDIKPANVPKPAARVRNRARKGPAIPVDLQVFTDRLVDELRQRGVSKLEIDLAARKADFDLVNRQTVHIQG